MSDGVPLTPEQKEIVDAVVQKSRSVFLTGRAGTGKSFLVGHLVDALVAKHGPDAVFATAPTAAAARMLPGGMTLASFGGYGLLPCNGDADLQTMMGNILASAEVVARWKTTLALFIDEISMVSGHVFERLHIIAGLLRQRQDAFFGGIQLITSGDFFQLPPPYKGAISWAFEAPCWGRGLQHFELTILFRQQEAALLAVLEEVRWGCLTPEGNATLKGRVAEQGHRTAMRVLARRDEVGIANNQAFKAQSGAEHVCVSGTMGLLFPPLTRFFPTTDSCCSHDSCFCSHH